jgi:hypothetical protein
MKVISGYSLLDVRCSLMAGANHLLLQAFNLMKDLPAGSLFQMSIFNLTGYRGKRL